MTTGIKIILAALLLALGVTAFSLFRNGTIKIPGITSARETSLGRKMAFTEYVKKGNTERCSVTQQNKNGTFEWVVYTYNGMARALFSDTSAQEIDIINGLLRDGTIYIWNSASSEGAYKLSATNPSEDSFFNTLTNYTCENWIGDESVFATPTTVTFEAR